MWSQRKTADVSVSQFPSSVAHTSSTMMTGRKPLRVSNLCGRKSYTWMRVFGLLKSVRPGQKGRTGWIRGSADLCFVCGVRIISGNDENYISSQRKKEAAV